jgi:dienelactone hydrolase
MGPFKVVDFRYADKPRPGVRFSTATIYYPSDAAPSFASLIIVPGYLHGESSMSSWAPFLASHGFVVMTIGTLNRTDDPFRRKDALLDALSALRKEHHRTDSPLFQKLDLNRMGVAGWSMGGGGAQLTAIDDPSLKAVIALCPWLPNAKFEHGVPTLIFAGTLDTIATVWRHARPHFEGLPKQTPKLLYEVMLGSHWVGNDPKNADAQIGRVGLSWLKVHLEGDMRYLPLLLRRPENANEYRHNFRQDVPNIDP